jgi:hypothetical protein
MEKKLFYFVLAFILPALFFASCEAFNPPTDNGVKDQTLGNYFKVNPDTIVKTVTVITPSDTVTVQVIDTIYHNDSIFIVIPGDTVYIQNPTDTIYLDWVNKYTFGYEKSLLSGNTYCDAEETSWMEVEKKDSKEHFEVKTTLGIKLRPATADTLFLRKMGKDIKYLTPRETDVNTSERSESSNAIVRKNKRTMVLEMDDSFTVEVPQYDEEAFVWDDGVMRQLPTMRIISTEYLGHNDYVIENDTVVKNGMVYNAIRRDAPVGIKLIVLPQVGEAYEETVILHADNTMDEMKQKIYVPDHPYVEPTIPEDTIPTPPDTIPTTPEDTIPDQPTPDEPGYPFQGGKVKAVYFTCAVDMANGVHQAILIQTENTVVPIVDSDYQMVSGTRYVYNPAEFTVTDDITAYNSVSYNGGVVPAVLRSENGTLRWYYNGDRVCSFKDASFASLLRTQSTVFSSTKVEDLARKVTFKNVGNTTEIYTPYYTVVISQ